MNASSLTNRNADPAISMDEPYRWVLEHCRPRAAPELDQGLENVAILAGLGMDSTSLTVGLLQPLAPFDANEARLLETQYGTEVMALLEGVSRIRELSSLSRSGEEAKSSVNEENLRKMLIAMVDDVRVVLIELAGHLRCLREARTAPESTRAALGQTAIDVYAPLANRLGVWQLKWEMEDFALRYTEPDTYRHLAADLAEKRVARERYIELLVGEIEAAMTAVGIECRVYGRPKHLYSIWKKMRRKGLTFDSLWDIRAVRILVDNVADCYSALGIVHTRWRHLPGEFDDYIATPKENGYRSIHTVVIGPEGKAVEVQIRTHAMHEENELGVAAHWRYKEHVRQDDGIDNKVLWLRQLLEWKEELADAGSFADDLKAGYEERRVYVFTPKGTVIDLPRGSTPIDFAYAIHTEVGHRARGARVNGKMVPLGHALHTGDQVQIQTVKSGGPSRDWLRSELGYIRTHRARSRIQQWFKHADHDQHLAEGRAMLERELTRLGLDDLSYDRIAEHTHFQRTEDLLIALGANDYKLSRALAPFRRALEKPDPRSLVKQRAPRQARPGNFSVNGVGNLLTRMGTCCQPVPGDAIVGFITRGRGVTIHRQDCNNVLNLEGESRSRLIEVDWGEAEQAAFPVEIRISAYHRSGLLSDLTQVLRDDRLDVLMLNMEHDDEQVAHIHLRVEISGLQKLSEVLNRLSRIPNVLQVRRVSG